MTTRTLIVMKEILHVAGTHSFYFINSYFYFRMLFLMLDKKELEELKQYWNNIILNKDTILTKGVI